ncbi:hypothetical protein CC78DRAFT_536391 [Lojkania enalia]|uniref:Uncharacterized protein n=1 Tax=Lojkania enalia TaxID=147567 RepID=A0A9P4N348_9PLEO|nr:hypothetical protein CC78DRAFT_536391 [Didymosphaeria enalia]
MVALSDIQASNARLPTHLTAVFVGATSGIGLYTLQSFARNCKNPTAYFIGRSQTSGSRIVSELKTVNPAGTFTFLQSDISLIKNVDAVCTQIKDKEKCINMLVMSQGIMTIGTENEEGILPLASLVLHSRIRFIVNLLPLLQAAPQLRRVLSIFTGTKEGPMPSPDLQMRNSGLSIMKMRAQGASSVTLSLEGVAKGAEDVGFVHAFPGPVRSNIARDSGIFLFLLRGLFKVIGPWVFIPETESGDRHLFLATSGMYPGRKREADGVEVGKEEVKMGTNGEVGSGVYSVDEKCESADEKVTQVLKRLREEGKDEIVWNTIQEDCLRITGREKI